MVSVCLPSDALLQHLLSYLSFSYLGCGVSLHGCPSKAQSLLLTLHNGYLLTSAPPDLERGIASLGPPVPVQPLLLTLDEGYLLTTALPDLQRGIAPLGPPVPVQPPPPLFWGTPKSLQMVTAAMKLKDAYSLEEKL